MDVEEFVSIATGWPGHVRLNTFDLDAIREIYIEDVYRARPHMQDAKVVDLGANVGVFSIWAKQNGARDVIGFEPCQETYEMALSNISRAPTGISIRRAAVGPHDGQSTVLYLGEVDAHKSYVTPTHEGASSTVKTLSLATIVKEEGPIDFLKVDIEGMEWEIFNTADTETMRAFLHIGMEFHGVDAPGSEPQPPGAFGALVTKLSETHCVHTLGAASKGGMLYADRF